MPLGDDIPLMKIKKEILLEKNENSIKFKLKWDFPIFKVVLGKIRMILSDKAEDIIADHLVEVKNIDFERKTLNKLQSLLDENKKGYPTSYEEDVLFKKNEKNLTLNERNCLIARMDEKETLNAFQTLLEFLHSGLLDNSLNGVDIDKIGYESYAEDLFDNFKLWGF